jgi:hypothetical protein
MVIVDDRNFISKALEEEGLNLFDYHEGHQVLGLKAFCEIDLKKHNDIVLMDLKTLLAVPGKIEVAKALLNTYQGVIFFTESSAEKELAWVKEQATFFNRILGVYELPMSELNWLILSNQLQFFWRLSQDQKALQKHMAAFSVELDQVLQNADWEMMKAKRIHESLVPKRQEEIKGVVFHNRYNAGDGGGGEFYDLHKTPYKVFQILVASESYLISSSLLGLLNNHKSHSFEPAQFIREAESDIETINSSKKKKAHVDLLVLELDLSNLSLKAYGNHKAEFYTQTKGSVHLHPESSFQLAKGEKFIVFSPGFIFNWKISSPHKDYTTFIKEHQSLNLPELMTELFIQLKQEQGEKFLKKDATVVMMEVNRHGMHQV